MQVQVKSFNPRPLCRERRVQRYYAGTYACCFNPRPLCRERLFLGDILYLKGRCFNPRPLCRERLYGNRKGINNMMFQSTPPMQGATVLFCCAGATGRSFNPRPLCRERLRRYAFHPLFKRFNPRPLCRERQLKVVERGNKTWVSIHAPYAGSDLVEPTFDEITDSGFNPRPLCRERPQLLHDALLSNSVSIHAPYAGSDSAPYLQ